MWGPWAHTRTQSAVQTRPRSEQRRALAPRAERGRALGFGKSEGLCLAEPEFCRELLQLLQLHCCNLGQPRATSGKLQSRKHAKLPKTAEPGRVPRVRSAGTRPTPAGRLCRRTVASRLLTLHYLWTTAAVATGHDRCGAQSKMLAEPLRKEGFSARGWPMPLPLSSSLGETWGGAGSTHRPWSSPSP